MSDPFKPRSLPDTPADSAVKVFDVVDPTAAHEGFDSLDQYIVHLDAGRFRARRVLVTLISCQVVFQRANARLRTRTTVGDDFVAFLVTAPTARGAVNGVAVAPDLVGIARPGAVAELVVEPNYRSVTVLIPPTRLQEHLERRGRSDEFRMPAEVKLHKASRVGVQRLYDLTRC